ncbi:MAG: hypothetical protein Q9162_000488 [Coniocarpon cinnabarinum]
MGLPQQQSVRLLHSFVAGQSFFLTQLAWHRRPDYFRRRFFASDPSPDRSSDSDSRQTPAAKSAAESLATESNSSEHTSPVSSSEHDEKKSQWGTAMPPGWEDDPDYNISKFNQLPHRHFGYNQHMIINEEFKEALRQVLWKFKAPIRYAFAYGSGVFPQSRTPPAILPPSPHTNPPEAVEKWQSTGQKSIDFIFGVSHTQHWHSLNLNEHRDHYSFLGSFGSGVVKYVQDNLGAGAYFHNYINVNGISIKYGVVNLDTLYRDLSDWNTLYLAGRLQKPVKILRDDPKIRLANQVNLISALRTALLMLPEKFTERDLYFGIAGLSYIGDPRMRFRAERPDKVYGIVDSQMTNFRQLYHPLVESLPNLQFNDSATSKAGWMGDPDVNANLVQDLDPKKRGNMVRRLPKSFRNKLYSDYRATFKLPPSEFNALVGGIKDDEDAFSRRFGNEFDKRIGTDKGISSAVKKVVMNTVMWPTVTQSFKGILTVGPLRSFRYVNEKRAKGRQKPVDPVPPSSKGHDGEND